MAEEIEKKLGRPAKKFSEKDVEQIKALARCHCPDSEIAAFLECGETTVKRHFGPLLKEWREAGKANLRAVQYKSAMRGNVTMLIWLGKQLLGQRDKNDFDMTHTLLVQDVITRPSGEKTVIESKFLPKDE